MAKRKHHSEELIIRILKEAEAGMPVADLLRKYNISQGTFYRWKSAYSGMQVSELKRLKALEKENERLKRLVADQALDIVMLKDINSKLVKPADRRGCRRLSASRSRNRCNPRLWLVQIVAEAVIATSRRPDDSPLRGAARQKAQQRKRWGYRRLQVLLRRDSERGPLIM